MKKTLLLLTALLLLFTLVNAAAADSQEDAYERAMAAANAGQYKSALSQFKALGGYRNSPDVVYTLGMYEHASEMKRIGDGVFAYMFHYSWGVMNLNTCTLSIPEWEEIYELDACGLCRVRNSNGAYGLIDAQGKVILDCSWWGVSEFSDGICTVWWKDNEGQYLFGLYSAEGRWITYNWSGIAGSYVSGKRYDKSVYLVAPVFVNDRVIAYNAAGQYVIMDRAGRIMGNVYWDEKPDISQLYPLMMRDGLYGYIDLNAQWIIEPQYQQAKPFSEGLAAVQAENGLWQFINPENEVVIPPVYNSVFSFSNGLAHVVQPGKFWQIIDKEGQLVYVVTDEMETKYQQAVAAMEAEQYNIAEALFADLIGYRDSYARMLEAEGKKTAESSKEYSRLAREYNAGLRRLEKGDYERAIKEFREAGNYPGAAEKLLEAQRGVYNIALTKISQGEYKSAISTLRTIEDYPETEATLRQTQALLYDQAADCIAQGAYTDAVSLLSYCEDYPGAEEMLNEAKQAIYDKAVEKMNAGEYREALMLFRSIDGFRDASEQSVKALELYQGSVLGQ